MANFDTVKSITDNVQSVLTKLGIHFSKKGFDDLKAIPRSLIPFGEIFYAGEIFEYTHGQRDGYAEAEYLIKVILQDSDPTVLMRETQKWVHAIRDALTVNALNIGALASSKLVSMVKTAGVEVENRADYGVLNCKATVRYRESS